MALATHADVENYSGKTFDKNSIPTDDNVDQYCIGAQAWMESMVTFAVEEVTETDELVDVEFPNKRLNIKYPIITFTKLEERQNDTFNVLTEGPTEDFTVDKKNGILKSTGSIRLRHLFPYGIFKAGLQVYRLNYSHGLESTDNRYIMAVDCVIKLAMIAVLEAEEGGNGMDAISSFSVGGMSVSFSGDAKKEALYNDAIKLIKSIRGEWRPYGNNG